MLPKHIDRPTRISYFRSQVVLTRFFSKQGVKFNFLRQNKYAKSRPIINYKRHNVVNTHTSSLQIMLQSPQKNTTRSLPTSFRTLVRRYFKFSRFSLFIYTLMIKSLISKLHYSHSVFLSFWPSKLVVFTSFGIKTPVRIFISKVR